MFLESIKFYELVEVLLKFNEPRFHLAGQPSSRDHMNRPLLLAIFSSWSLRACSYDPGNRTGRQTRSRLIVMFLLKIPLRSYGQTGWPAKRYLGRRCRDLGKRAGIFPFEHSHVEIRIRARNYVIDFSNFQVNISINVKFHPGRRDENNHMNVREIYPAQWAGSVTGIM